MSKQAEADLILKLYDLRREETLRKARDWYFMTFNPTTIEDYKNYVFSPQSGYLRMVLTYWDMAATLVNHGAIDLDLFNDANGEHIGVFAKVENLLADIRALYSPQFLVNLEKLIDNTKGGRERTSMQRERMKGIHAEMTTRNAAAKA